MDYYSSAQGAPPPPIFHLNARSNSSFDALRSSNGSNAADPRLEDRLRQMTLQAREGKQTDSVPYPERPGEPDCSYYLRTGVCGFGMNCRFNHPPPHKPGVTSAQPKEEFSGKIGHLECQYYMETGTCKFGATCKYYHPQEKTPPAASGQVQLNFLGLPLRPGEKECTYYTRTGSCKYGLACKFHHPQPSAVGTPSATTDLPLHASAVSSSMPASPCATTLSPSTPLELYQTGTPSWPLPGGQYMHGPKLPGASSQVPSVVSLSQSLSMPGYSTPQPSAVGTATRTTGLPPGSTPGFSTAASFSATTGSSSASASVPYQAGIPSVPVAEALHMQGPNFPGASSHVPGVVSASQFMSTPAWSTSQSSAAGAPTMMQGLPLGGNTSSSSMPGYLCATTSTPSTLASVPYQAGIPSLPASGALYSHGPKLPASSSHVPAVVSPSQLMSVPGLSASQGLTSPLLSLDGPQQATGTGFIYGTGQQQAGLATRSERVHTVPSVGMGALSLQNQMTQNGINFPERPGQPDCHHYMKTGECKFGANCKYHHPKDRATSSSLYTLSPIGLPLRPGKLPCTFYVKNGICKFGSVCKFDHPVSRLAYNSSASSFNDMPFDPPFRGFMNTTLLSSSDSSLEASKVQ